MQSGISASKELQDAFNNLVSSSSQRGLLATIKNETLVPLETLQANGDFRSDLSGLSQHLSKDEARYILLKQDGSAADGYVAVTYVPDAANVRQKMLFASTRLTLVRELGVERFRETVFCTTAEELTPEGWDRHEKHNRLDAPLTEEEAGLKYIKEAEALESGGTGGKSLPSAGIALNLGDEVSNAFESLKDSREGSLVMIKIDVPTETLHLDASKQDIQPADLSSEISSSEPRYSFYNYPGQQGVVFMYSCPSKSKIKERMVYASSRSQLVTLASNVGLNITKRLEASSPDEWSASTLASEFQEQKVESKGFARPKRPGRR
ncbi:actin monomer binding protein-like protein, partial [Aureobasidium melanogenum]